MLLAKAEKVNDSYLSRVLRLTLLAPDILERILDGQQPRSLELKFLMQRLPSFWERFSASNASARGEIPKLLSLSLRVQMAR